MGRFEGLDPGKEFTLKSVKTHLKMKIKDRDSTEAVLENISIS